MIKKNLFKKLGTIFLAVFICFNGVEATASLPIPNPNVIAVIPEGSESWDRFFRQARPAAPNPGVTVNTPSSNRNRNRINDFMQNYQRLVDQPLFDLRNSFTRRLGFEVVENANTEDENVRIHVFSDNSQAINFAARLNTLIHRITDRLGTPLKDAHTRSIIGNINGRPLFDGDRLKQNLAPLNTQQNVDEMNNINEELTRLTRELNEIPERRPTEEDFNAGRCVDSGVDDL